MRIGIIGYFDPFTIKSFLDQDSQKKAFHVNNAATAVNTLVQEFLNQGHYVRIFTTYNELGKTIVLKGRNVEVHLLSRSCSIKKTGIFSRLIMIPRLRRYIHDKLYDLEVLHAQWTYDFALAASYYVNILPVLCTVRDWCPYIYSMQQGIKGKFFWGISWLIFLRVFKCTKIHFIANSEYTKERIMRKWPQLNVPVIPNPIKSSYILVNRKDYPRYPIFISISQGIDKRKNYENLLQAFYKLKREHKECELILVGRDFVVSNKYVQGWINNGLMEGVILKGNVNHNDLINILDSSSILIHPSLEETFGNTLLEAMSRRLPVIGGRDSGAVPWVLENGICGCLCDVGDVNDIYTAMKKVIKDDVYRMNIINNATVTLLNKYADYMIIKEHLSLYKRVARIDFNNNGLC